MNLKTALFVSVTIMASGVSAQTSLSENAFGYGKKLYHEGFYDMAVMQFQDYIGQYPTAPDLCEALFLQGEALFHLRNYKDAGNVYLKVILQFPDKTEAPAAYYRFALCFEKLGQTDAAVQNYLRAFDYFPEHPMGQESLYRAALVSAKQKNPDAALSSLKLLSAQKLSMDLLARTEFLKADILTEQDRYEDAMTVLEPFTQTGIRQEDKIHAWLKAGQIHQQTGHYDQAKSAYDKVFNQTGADSLRGEAAYHMGSVHFLLKDFSQASRFFQTCLGFPAVAGHFYSASMMLGKCALYTGNPEDAVRYFTDASVLGSTVEERLGSLVGLAQALDANGEPEKACQILKQALNTPDLPSEYHKRLILELAGVLRKNNTEEAVQVLAEYADRDQSDAMHPYIQFYVARIYIEKGLLQPAWSALRALWQRFPDHELAPRAYFMAAGSLERAGQEQQAAELIRYIETRYPGSAYADSARIQWMVKRRPTPELTEQNFVMLQTLFAETVSHPEDTDNLFRYARLLVDGFGLYEAAIPLLKSCLGDNEQTLDRAELYFTMGVAWLNGRSPSRQDSAAVYMQKVWNEFPGHPRIRDAAVAYARLLKANDDRIIQIFRQVLKQSGGAGPDELNEAVGKYYLKKDSLEKALPYFKNWADSDTLNRPMPVFYLGRTYALLNRPATADSLLQTVQNAYSRHGWIPRILFERSRLLEKMQNDADALSLLEQLLEHPVDPFLADSARMAAGNMYLEIHDFEKAYKLFKTLVLQDSVRMLAFSYGLLSEKPAVHAEALAGWAKACAGLGLFGQARSLYFDYFDRYSQDQTALLMTFAQISEQEGNPVRAIQYLDQLQGVSEMDTLQIWLASLYEKAGKYGEAYTHYQQALHSASRHAMRINQRIILNLLKQDKIPEGESRINVFEKTYRKEPDFEPMMAEILYEKGKAHFRQKDFDLAENQFQRIKDKFKKTGFRASAELEIGRIRIVTNKIDDALEILTRMTSDYYGNSIYYQVYLNLGDLYYRLQQFENALNAFKIAAKDSASMGNRQLASRYMIRIYETMGLWEGALALTRTYIREYPDADDAVQKQVQIGNFYMHLKDYDRAIEQFKKTQQTADSETEAEIQYWIGKCYADMGRLDRAVLEYLKVKYISKPTKLPWASTALYEAAQAYLKMGKPWEAKIIFEKIVRFEGATSDLGRIARQRIEEIGQGKYAENGP
ncbi:tetratricopeptide repeat protein [bacterium]|nr:tetratricopeptide repeat protein [bacterium]